MATMVHKAGTALATGARSSGITGVYTQTSGESAGGELKLIFDETGADLAAYVTDPHKEHTFEAVLAANAPDHEIGDIVLLPDGDTPCLVTKWDKTESNEDVKKVSIGLRPTSLSAPAQSSSSGGGGGGGEG